MQCPPTNPGLYELKQCIDSTLETSKEELNSSKFLSFSCSSSDLKKHNCYVQPIFYPTVPKNSARLRITITPKRSYSDIDNLLGAIQDIWFKSKKRKVKTTFNSVAI